jgi:hypothetical protein
LANRATTDRYSALARVTTALHVERVRGEGGREEERCGEVRVQAPLYTTRRGRGIGGTTVELSGGAWP